MAKLYTALEAKGLTVRKWSGLSTRDRERCGDLWGYLSQLWEFCGLNSKPSWFRSEGSWFERYGTMGCERYKFWLDSLHRRKELESMIAAVEQLGERDNG